MIEPKPSKAAEARERILAIAARMLRESGYAQMSMRDLAAEAGMKAASLYYHFQSKDALAAEVMRLGVSAVDEAVREALTKAGAAPEERLTTAMQVHLETLVSVGDFSGAHIRCYAFVPDTIRADLREVRRSYDRLWRELISAYLETPTDSKEARYLHRALIGALNWSLDWFDGDRDSVDEYVRFVARMLPKH